MDMQESSEKVYRNRGNADLLALIPEKGKTVLDLGCGAGDNARVLVGQGNTVDGITLSEAEASIVRGFTRNVWVYNLENGLPADMHGTYDVIILSHVLEHICYPSKLLSDVKRVMHPGSRLIIALPNLMHYQSRIQLIFGNFNYRDAGVWDYTHFRWYTFKTAQKLLRDHGFIVEYAGVAGELPFGRITKRIFPAAIQKFLYRILTSISKGFFGSQLLLAGGLPAVSGKS